MKRTAAAIAALLGGVMMLSTVQAGEIRAGAVSCLTQKSLKKYEKFMTGGNEDFARELLASAQCVIKDTPERAVKDSAVGEFTRVETLEGFKVWVRTPDFNEQAGKSNLKPEGLVEKAVKAYKASETAPQKGK